MRRVLFIAYFFPPLGGAGVQRAAKFTRYLPDFGWEPVIVTARNRSYWLVDESLLDEIPPAVNVRRTASPDGPWLMAKLRGEERVARGTRAGVATSRLRWLASFAFLPDSYRPWKSFALREARRVLRELNIDAVLTTSSPDTAHLIGLDIKRESGYPWVADFRDPWTRRIAFDPPTPWHRRWHEAREEAVLTEADRVVVTSDETRDDFVARHRSLPENHVAVIPNGFDAADFPTPSHDTPNWDRFRLMNVGQLTAKRTVQPLLPVVDGFLRERPEARDVTDIRFIGPRELENDELVRAASLDDVIAFRPPRPHGEATRALREAHVVLLVESMTDRGGLVAQGKLYEGFYNGRPILAVVPAGAVSRLLGETGGGLAVDDRSVATGVDFLVRAFDAWRERKLLPGADGASLRRYERRSLAGDLARVLEGVQMG